MQKVINSRILPIRKQVTAAAATQTMKLKISEIPGSYVVAKLKAEPANCDLLCQKSYDGEFVTISTTPDEISIVCQKSEQNMNLLNGHATIESDWSLIRVLGQLEFEMVGVIARFSSILADANIPIFCLSTFDTDYILVKGTRLSDAIQSLREHGIELVD